jgi:hypothetical protein
MAAAANRPAIVVEWLDGGSAFYSLVNGSCHEDETRRLLIIKRKSEEVPGTQHHRTVIPFEVLRGWEVYPRLGPVPLKEDWYHRGPCHECRICKSNGCYVYNPPGHPDEIDEHHFCAQGCNGEPWK